MVPDEASDVALPLDLPHTGYPHPHTGDGSHYGQDRGHYCEDETNTAWVAAREAGDGGLT